MKRDTKFTLALLALTIGIAALIVTALDISIRHALAKYNQCDHAALLAACRQMITDRNTYTNDPSYSPSPPELGDITLWRENSSYGPTIPAMIRNLNPLSITVRTNLLIINDPSSIPPFRRGIIAFASDAREQFGTKQYIDGLWYWNGEFQSEEMRNRFYGVNSDK